MSAEMGEYLVGAYLKVIEECDFIGYNMRPPGGGIRGLGEIDVIGLRFSDETAFLCEVTTHIDGLLIKTPRHTVERIRQKFSRQQDYARAQLTNFPSLRFQYWTPVVRSKMLLEELPRIDPLLEMIMNGEYTRRIGLLRKQAGRRKNIEGNPAFRLLQILEHLRAEEPSVPA
jgi:hypothetical protein